VCCGDIATIVKNTTLGVGNELFLVFVFRFELLFEFPELAAIAAATITTRKTIAMMPV
jgi:hypothetical protein